MFEDPLSVVSCDVPLGWVVTSESGIFRLEFEHIQKPRERIVLSVHASACSRIQDEDAWVAAARAQWKFPPSAARVQLQGVTGIQACWQEGSAWRTRIARRGADLDLVLDHRGDARDKRTQRDLARLVAGAVLPVMHKTEGAEEVQQVVATVDAVAREGSSEFEKALLRAIEVLTARWQSSLAQELRAADVTALKELVKLQFRYASAGADTRRLLRLQAIVLRACPRNREDRPYQPLHEAIERQTHQELAPAMGIIPNVFVRIRQAHNQPEDPRLTEIPEAALRLKLANYLLQHLRKKLVTDPERYDRHDTATCAREIVDSVLFACIEMREQDLVPVELLLALGEPLIFLIDTSSAADRMQDVAEAGALLSDQAARILRLASTDERTTAAANRFLLIGTVAHANALLAAGDEASLRDALDLLDRALAIASKPAQSADVEVLNIRHLEALAALQLGDLERARAAAVIGSGVATGAGNQNQQASFFTWVREVVSAIQGEERRARSLPELELELERKRNETYDVVLDRLCRRLEQAIEENPLSLTTLERLVLAGKLVDPARSNLEAAARSLMDLRRLLLERSPDLRIGADDSLLARQLAAGHVEDLMRARNIVSSALGIDHACARSLVLDLATQPLAVSKIRDATRSPDVVTIAVERVMRTSAPPSFRVRPPWAAFRTPAWLCERADHLRRWCSDLVGVVGGTPLTESEMLECIERHGEQILLLYYPVAGKIGGFLLRPGQTPEFQSTTASAEEVLQAAEHLESGLGVWKSDRGQSRNRRSSAGVVQDHWAAAGALSNMLLAPFAAALSRESRLTIIPYRKLASIPFGLLPDGRQRPLCESYVLTIVSSVSTLRVLQLRGTPRRSRAAFVLGDPDTKIKGVDRLAGAAEEARRLAARLRAKTPPWDVHYIHGVSATPMAYKALAANSDLVHLACHGSVGNVARDSALVLAPNDSGTGLLKPSDIEAVPLRSAVVFLSACRSGAGRPTTDGTIGLSRAFLTAGADAVVASLWNVPDLSTRMLVDSFYDAYLSGADVASSLQRATIATRQALAEMRGCSSPREVHPAEWGSFFVLGRGTTSRG